jgi:serine/threonine protein kinase
LWTALPVVQRSEGTGARQRLFSWHNRGRGVLLHVARGLHYLHSRRIVHMDLKSANILLTRTGVAKIADVGMARALSKSYLSLLSGGMGTFAWSAPEVLAGKRCDEKVDIYSFGVVIWEVCTGESPVRGAMRALTPDDCPAAVAELYEACTAERPEERPTAGEVMTRLMGLVQRDGVGQQEQQRQHFGATKFFRFGRK